MVLFNNGSVKGQLQHLKNKFQSYSQTMGPMLGLLRRQPNLAPLHLQMSQPGLKTVKTAIILPSLINEPDARLKGQRNSWIIWKKSYFLKSKYNQIHEYHQNIQSWLSHLQQ